MSHWRNAVDGLRNLFGRARAERELDEELSAYLENSIDAKTRSGMSRTEALRTARIEMGSRNSVKHRVRETGWETALEELWNDVRLSLRVLLRSPGFALVAILSLALGIGANTALFSLIDRVMLRSLPVVEPSELVLFGEGKWIGSTSGLPDRGWDLYSYRLYQSIREKTQAFSNVAAIDSIEFATHGTLAGEGRKLVSASLVSGSYFSLLGVRPAIGRVLTDADDAAAGAGAVAVASYAWWQAHGSDPAIIGKAIEIEGVNYTIVGVAAPGFVGTMIGETPNLWIPLSMEKQISPQWNGLEDKSFLSLYVIARLKPGVSRAQAEASTNVLFKQILQRDYLSPTPAQKEMEALSKAHIELTSAGRGLSHLRAQFSLPLEILIVIAALVLLIACANLANLLMARGASRTRELAMRMAIGARRGRLIRQLLTESFVLALSGAALGVASAWRAGHMLLTMATTSKEVAGMDVNPDLRVLAFTLGLTLLTALLFGMAPAIRATRLDLTGALKQGRGIAAPQMKPTLARGLIVGQIALSLVLLVAATLFLRSLVKLTSVDTGFNRSNTFVVGPDLYASGMKPDAEATRYEDEVERQVENVPGVTAAGFSIFTFNGGMWSDDITAQGMPLTQATSRDVLFNIVGKDFLRAMGLPMLAGRGFDGRDQKDAPKVAIINETMANLFFPGISPIGRHFGFGHDVAHAGDIEIVGVVKNAKYTAVDEPPEPAAYLYFVQSPQFLNSLTVRYQGDARQILPAVRKAIAGVNGNVPIGAVSSLAESIDESTAYPRLISRLSAFFGLLAAFLVCLGIYGLLSYAVARRTSEIGVRMALGATRWSVLGLILRETLVLVALGVAIGAPLSIVGNRLVAKLLYGLSPLDPASLIAAAVMMAAIAMLAGYIPARRASRVEPTEALRCE